MANKPLYSAVEKCAMAHGRTPRKWKEGEYFGSAESTIVKQNHPTFFSWFWSNENKITQKIESIKWFPWAVNHITHYRKSCRWFWQLIYFLNRTSGSVTKTSWQEAVSSRFAVRLLHFQSWGSRMSGATTKTILLLFFVLQTTRAMHMKPSLEKAQCDRWL